MIFFRNWKDKKVERSKCIEGSLCRLVTESEKCIEVGECFVSVENKRVGSGCGMYYPLIADQCSGFGLNPKLVEDDWRVLKGRS